MDASFVDKIPQLLLVFVPGYIALRLNQTYTSEKRTDNFHTVVHSIIFSFVISICYTGIVEIVPASIEKLLENEFWKPLIHLVMGVLFGFVSVKIENNKVGKILSKLFNNALSPEPTVWNVAMKHTDGAWGIVYLNNGMIYSGVLKYYTSDPDDTNKEILLTQYQSYRVVSSSGDEGGSSKLVSDYEGNKNAAVLLARENIISIEIIKGTNE